MNPGNYPSDLSSIAFERQQKRMRISSYDKTGGNDDRIHLRPGETPCIAEIDKPGVITHIWITMAGEDGMEDDYLRKVTLRMYWDGEKNPSVEAPIGDFFGMGHGKCKNYVSAPLEMSPEDGKGFNCWFPMPFESAKIEVQNECDVTFKFYFYIDYEEYEKLPEGMLRFHSQFRRENPTKGISDEGMENKEFCFGGKNLDGKENYVLMEAQGCGHYVGCNVNIHNLRDTAKWDWPGEGDDMIFIDGEPWPPRLHGTGTEDYFNMSWCPTQEYNAPYHGIILPGKDNWKGYITYYRYHIKDPVMFKKSIKVTIEHGHANRRSDDWSSTAYWYQSEPHMPFGRYPSKEERQPMKEEIL